MADTGPIDGDMAWGLGYFRLSHLPYQRAGLQQFASGGVLLKVLGSKRNGGPDWKDAICTIVNVRSVQRTIFGLCEGGSKVIEGVNWGQSRINLSQIGL